MAGKASNAERDLRLRTSGHHPGGGGQLAGGLPVRQPVRLDGGTEQTHWAPLFVWLQVLLPPTLLLSKGTLSQEFLIIHANRLARTPDERVLNSYSFSLLTCVICSRNVAHVTCILVYSSLLIFQAQLEQNYLTLGAHFLSRTKICLSYT